MIISDIARHISSSSSIDIVTHVMPDGDAAGSALALALALDKQGLRTIVVKNDTFPKNYSFLPGQNLMVDFRDISERPKTLVALDCGDAERLGKAKALLDKAETVINLDHHISNTMFGNLNLIDTNAAATAEIVYQLIKLMGVKIDIDIGTCLYTAIIADTGHFKYDNTTWITHAISGELINIGVNASNIARHVFSSRTFSKTKLIGKAIESINIYHEGKTAVMVVTRKVLDHIGSSPDEMEGIIDFARDIEGVEVAVLLKEVEENEFKIGFRSKEYMDVSEIAGSFGGGGHKKASGCTVKGRLEDVQEQILENIEKAYV